MKILFISNEDKIKRNTPDREFLNRYYYRVIPYGSTDEEIIEAGKECEIIIADAIQPISAYVINSLPNLKMIHSEGVAFNMIDLKAATERQVFVCNCKGMNAHSVAEQTLLLMLGVIKDVIKGDAAVKSGNQMNVKLGVMKNGNLLELEECNIGLVGFGDIAKETARLLSVFGCKVYYFATHRHEAEESAFGVEYLDLPDLLRECDMISLHVPVTEKTMHMVDDVFLTQMKRGAYLINSSRGELVDNNALVKALKDGRITAYGVDTIAPEPVQADNPLFLAGDEVKDKILSSCHIGGITAKAFRRGYSMIWDAIQKVEKGERPEHIVNF